MSKPRPPRTPRNDLGALGGWFPQLLRAGGGSNILPLALESVVHSLSKSRWIRVRGLFESHICPCRDALAICCLHALEHLIVALESQLSYGVLVSLPSLWRRSLGDEL